MASLFVAETCGFSGAHTCARRLGEVAGHPDGPPCMVRDEGLPSNLLYGFACLSSTTEYVPHVLIIVSSPN